MDEFCCQLCYSETGELVSLLSCGHCAHPECLGDQVCFIEGCDGKPSAYQGMDAILIANVLARLVDFIELPRQLLESRERNLVSHIESFRDDYPLAWACKLMNMAKDFSQDRIYVHKLEVKGKHRTYRELDDVRIRKEMLEMKNWIGKQEKQLDKLHQIEKVSETVIEFPTVQYLVLKFTNTARYEFFYKEVIIKSMDWCKFEQRDVHNCLMGITDVYCGEEQLVKSVIAESKRKIRIDMACGYSALLWVNLDYNLSLNLTKHSDVMLVVALRVGMLSKYEYFGEKAGTGPKTGDIFCQVMAALPLV